MSRSVKESGGSRARSELGVASGGGVVSLCSSLCQSMSMLSVFLRFHKVRRKHLEKKSGKPANTDEELTKLRAKVCIN